MDFISNKSFQIEEMLKVLNIQSIEELFSAVPKEILLKAPIEDDGLSEYEGLKMMEQLAHKNTFLNYDSYLGAGAYEHHVPAIVSSICSKSEFLTSYTSYQAEVSQGNLQAIFEFQSCITALTGLDAANASLYDGASSAAESILMSMRLNKDRKKVLIADSLHPHYKEVIKQYLHPHAIEIHWLKFLNDGSLDLAEYESKIDEDTIAVLVGYPNFFGIVEDLRKISALSKQKGAITIVSANPLAYGLYLSALELGVDIAVGDCQPFGLNLQFGGPCAGYIACKEEYIRQLPGRIVGETKDVEGKRGFVLTLQAREQHIRREKATSNVCTNQSLAALASLIAMLYYGKEGIKKLALMNYQKASYLKHKLSEITGVKLLNNGPFLNEFAFKPIKPLQETLEAMKAENILAGIDLGLYYPRMQGYLLTAVTETKTKEQLDRYIEVLKNV